MYNRYRLPLILIVVFLSLSARSSDSEVFSVGSLKARAGESVSGFLAINSLNGLATQVPISVIRGQKPGPVLALIAGVYMPVTGNTQLDKASRGMALAFGLDHIVIDEGPILPRDASLYTDHTALSRGIPAITTETGQLGSNAEHWVGLAERGIANLMRHLGMLEGSVEENKGIVWLTGYEVIKSPVTGLFQPSVRDGYAIAKDGLLGQLVDAFGDKITDVRAPFAGVVNYVVATPPVNEGDPVAMISRIKEH